MKLIYLTAISFLLVHCSNTKSQDSGVADSTAIDSRSAVEVADVENTEVYEEIPDEPEDDSLATAIAYAVNETSIKILAGSGDYYTISADYNGYESGSQSTWYFDTELNKKYCTGSWDSEGTSGSYTYYFEQDDLIAYTSEDLYQESSETTQFHTAFTPVYGFTKASSEAGENITYLYESSYNTSNAAAKNEFSNLLNLIRGNIDNATITDQEVSIQIAEVDSVNYGMEVTISQNYSISKVLFDKLIKE